MLGGVWRGGDGVQREDERGDPMDHTLEVPFPQFRDALSACLSAWHLCTTYCARFSWVFPNSDGIQQRPQAGSLAGARGSLGQPGTLQQ